MNRSTAKTRPPRFMVNPRGTVTAESYQGWRDAGPGRRTPPMPGRCLMNSEVEEEIVSGRGHIQARNGSVFLYFGTQPVIIKVPS